MPVKTTNDLLVLRSDAYALGEDFVLDQIPEDLPFVELDRHYKTVDDFDKRFPAGVPSLKGATSLTVAGDWSFESGVVVRGEATLDGDHGRVASGTVLGDDDSA